MKKILPLILFVVIANGFSQTKNFIDQPYIETMSKVDTLVTPDKIFMNIIITEQDTKGKISVEELESKMETVLKSLSIDTKKDLTLNDLASNFKKYFLRRQDVLKSKSYTLILKDAITAGKVIIALENLKISNVTIEKTEYSEIEELKLTLKSRAVLKAKKQAQFMAEPLGQKVGSPIFISDLSGSSIYRSNRAENNMFLAKVSSSEKDFTPADISFEKIKVESIISIKFKIE
ncbi:MAG: SIMPL domain-containing protein [Aureibaculum sp.]|nr:SIMPL domain-containing protein [Aureibaculum sp.]